MLLLRRRLGPLFSAADHLLTLLHQRSAPTYRKMSSFLRRCARCTSSNATVRRRRIDKRLSQLHGLLLARPISPTSDPFARVADSDSEQPNKEQIRSGGEHAALRGEPEEIRRKR